MNSPLLARLAESPLVEIVADGTSKIMTKTFD